MPAEARLISARGPEAGGEHRLTGEATIGRDPGNTVVLAARGISAHHARLHFDAERGAWVLEDLESLNGTELDGLPVTGAEPLGDLHAIDFAGSERFLFVTGPRPRPDSEPAGEGTRVERLAPDLPAELARRLERSGAAADPDSTTVERRPTPLPDALGRRLRDDESE